jgi:hypothetical protein
MRVEGRNWQSHRLILLSATLMMTLDLARRAGRRPTVARVGVPFSRPTTPPPSLHTSPPTVICSPGRGLPTAQNTVPSEVQCAVQWTTTTVYCSV